MKLRQGTEKLRQGLDKMRRRREELVQKHEELISRAKMAHARVRVQQAITSVSVMLPIDADEDELEVESRFAQLKAGQPPRLTSGFWIDRRASTANGLRRRVSHGARCRDWCVSIRLGILLCGSRSGTARA